MPAQQLDFSEGRCPSLLVLPHVPGIQGSLLLACSPLGKQGLHPCVHSAAVAVKLMVGESLFEPFMARHSVGHFLGIVL